MSFKVTYVFVWFVLLILQINGNKNESNSNNDCALCLHIMQTVKELAVKSSILPSLSLLNYCSIAELDVETKQFCYHLDSIKGDVQRVLDAGAPEKRICRKIKALSPTLCKSSSKLNKLNLKNGHVTSKLNKPAKRNTLIYI